MDDDESDDEIDFEVLNLEPEPADSSEREEKTQEEQSVDEEMQESSTEGFKLGVNTSITLEIIDENKIYRIKAPEEVLFLF